MAAEREQRLRAFSLYAQAKVAWQLGGDMLPLARSRALEAWSCWISWSAQDGKNG